VNKVVYVKAYFKLLGYGRNQSEVWSDSEVDGESLNNDIGQAVRQLNIDGYEVLSMMPVTSGRFQDDSYGFSYTEGVTIVAKKFV